MKITAKHFEKSVGAKPKDDDLTRSNCKHGGEFGHNHCGWDTGRDMPNFIPGIAHYKKSGLVQVGKKWVNIKVIGCA